MKSKSIGDGQTLVIPQGRDNSDVMKGDAPMKMGGSSTSLDHSIKGSSANQKSH